MSELETDLVMVEKFEKERERFAKEQYDNSIYGNDEYDETSVLTFNECTKIVVQYAYEMDTQIENSRVEI